MTGQHVAAALAAAQRPLIVAGSGLFYAGTGDEMLTFAEKYSIPVVVPIWDRGPSIVGPKLFMGVLGAATGGPGLLPDADCILWQVQSMTTGQVFCRRAMSARIFSKAAGRHWQRRMNGPEESRFGMARQRRICATLAFQQRS